MRLLARSARPRAAAAPPWAPRRVTLTAATRTAQRAASTTVAPPASASASAPQKASPAPVRVDHLAPAARATRSARSPSTTSTPSLAPSVTTTARAARAERASVAGSPVRPVSVSSSPRLGTRTSTGRASARAGAGLSTTVPPAAAIGRLDAADAAPRAAASVTGAPAQDLARGRDVARADVRVGARAHDDRVLAPRRRPRSAPSPMARPGDPRVTCSTSTPSSARPSRSRAPCASAPTRPTIADLAAQARRGDRLVGALAARQLAAVAAEHGLARHRVVLDGRPRGRG